MWDDKAHRLALLELYQTGRLPRRHAQQMAWEHLSRLSWARASSRRNEIELVGEHRIRVETLLDQRWPEWRETAQALSEAGYPPTPRGLSALETARRLDAFGTAETLPARLHHKTAAALMAPHSKAAVGARGRLLLEEIELTRDGIVRLRLPHGVVICQGEISLDGGEVSRVLGEVAISDRALRDGTHLVGHFDAVLLVENLGAFVDLVPPPGWVVAQVPGWNTATVHRFIATCSQFPVVVFGDLDPSGVRIALHLRRRWPNLQWAVPTFWAEQIDDALEGEWPAELDLSDAPPLVRSLAERGRWLEQERIVLDPRLALHLAGLLR